VSGLALRVYLDMSLTENQNVKSIRLIRRKEVQSKTGLGASSIYALMDQDKFPKPITLSVRRVAWIESDIDQWVAERISKHQFKLAQKG
jgi:prophage regulatory protein